MQLEENISQMAPAWPPLVPLLEGMNAFLQIYLGENGSSGPTGPAMKLLLILAINFVSRKFEFKSHGFWGPQYSEHDQSLAPVMSRAETPPKIHAAFTDHKMTFTGPRRVLLLFPEVPV